MIPARPRRSRLFPARLLACVLRALCIVLLMGAGRFVIAAPALAVAASAPKRFDIPAGIASATLKQFSTQSGEQVLYSAETVDGLKTKPVKGLFHARDAIERMLAGTDLRAIQDAKTGAFAIMRAPAAKGVAPESSAPAPERRGAMPAESPSSP